MFVEMIIGGLLASQDSDLIIIGRPTPESYGASVYMTCTRLEVEVEYHNSVERGVQKLKGQAKYARQGKSFNDALAEVKSRSRAVYDVDLSCEAENEIAIAIKTTTEGGEQQTWHLIVNQMLEVEVKGPQTVSEEN